MRVKEIQEELRERQVSYSDCFDKENLIQRLKEARATTTRGGKQDEDDEDDEIIPEVLDPKDFTALDDEEPKSADYEKKLSKLRGMTVGELREECGKRRLDWTKFVDKEQIVQALIKKMEQRIEYSVSGIIRPGAVADLTADQLELELSQKSEVALLLNIYAPWCSPCRMMGPELEDAAFRLGTQMRIASLDSEKYPVIAQRLGAGGLPTNLILNGGEELQRIEGGLRRDQILTFVDPFISR